MSPPLLYDTSIYRLLYDPKKWDSFINSLLHYEPSCEEHNYTIVSTPPLLLLEYIGISLKKINQRLEKAIKAEIDKINTYITGQDRNCDRLDGIMDFCLQFYKTQEELQLLTILERATDQYQNHTKIHPHLEKLHEIAIQQEIANPELIDRLCNTLALDATDRFISLAIDDEIPLEKRDSVYSDCCGHLLNVRYSLTSKGWNLSSSRTLLDLFYRYNKRRSDDKHILPAPVLRLHDDAGDSEILHYSVMGDLVDWSIPKQLCYRPITVFVDLNEKEDFLSRVRQYKISLDYAYEFKEWDNKSQKGIIYFVDRLTCKIQERIDISTII